MKDRMRGRTKRTLFFASSFNFEDSFPQQMTARFKSILCLGDSLTEGYYKFGLKYHPYTRRFEVLYNQHIGNGSALKVTNAGVSGETVEEITERYSDLTKKNVRPEWIQVKEWPVDGWTQI